MLELTVNAKSPAAITAALKKIREMVSTGAVEKTVPVHILLGPGIYRESIRYNMANPLIMESTAGTSADKCVVKADNCEAFHSGRENRAIFVLGPNVTNITLRNFTIENLHLKSVQLKNTKPDGAEAFVWNNDTGTLLAEGMSFIGRQNTIYVKGFSWFLNCSVTGDTDFIYGEPETSFFENCSINIREDNRGDFNGYAVKARSAEGKKGFIFSSCTFTGESRPKAQLYAYRTAGLGSAESKKDFDAAVFLNCKIGENFNSDFVWDDDLVLNVYPRGNALSGIREYKTVCVASDGTESPADTSRRNVKCYTLTDDDYFKYYASRYLILGETPFAASLD